MKKTFELKEKPSCALTNCIEGWNDDGGHSFVITLMDDGIANLFLFEEEELRIISKLNFTSTATQEDQIIRSCSTVTGIFVISIGTVLFAFDTRNLYQQFKQQQQQQQQLMQLKEFASWNSCITIITSAICLSEPGKYLIAIGGCGGVEISTINQDGSNQKGEIRLLLLEDCSVSAIAFSSDSKLIIVGTVSGRIFIFDTIAWKEIYNYNCCFYDKIHFSRPTAISSLILNSITTSQQQELMNTVLISSWNDSVIVFQGKSNTNWNHIEQFSYDLYESPTSSQCNHSFSKLLYFGNSLWIM